MDDSDGDEGQVAAFETPRPYMRQATGKRRHELDESENEDTSWSKREGRPPSRYKDYVIMSALLRKPTKARDLRVPTSFCEASPQAANWRAAMNDKMAALKQKKVLETIERIPSDKRAIRTRWVYAVKSDESGNVAQFKARLAARGFCQVP